MTLGCDIRVKSCALLGGSSVKTSNPAPPHLLSYLKSNIYINGTQNKLKSRLFVLKYKLTFKALKSAASSTIPPLATLTIFNPFLHLLNTSSLIRSNLKNKFIFLIGTTFYSIIEYVYF